jgi:hypothetical protein
MKKDNKLFTLLLLTALLVFFNLSLPQNVCAQNVAYDESLEARTVEIVDIGSAVYCKKTTDPYWLEASVGIKLNEGDMLKTSTSVDSYAELLVVEEKENGLKGVIRLASATQAVIGIYNDDINEVKLDKGELSCIIENQKKNSTFEVRTPTAVCGSRGTDFKVTYNPVTTASCFKNSIFMQQTGPGGKPKGDKFIIKQGFKKTIGSGFIGQNKKLSSSEKKNWQRWRSGASKKLNNSSNSSGETSGNNKKGLQRDARQMEQEGEKGKEDADEDKKDEQDSQGSAVRDDTNKDSDGDGILDIYDLYPNDPNRASGNDLDGDGIDDEFDTDDDGDGVCDSGDAFPREYYEQYDSDSDGYGNNEDAFPDDATIHTDSTVKGYGSRYEMRQKFYALIEEGDIRNDIAQHRKDIYWRDMDARVTQLTDAQMHKVMKDRWGNRVRVEQYIMRPADNQVQILDINLRTADASGDDRHGLATLSFTTTFNRNIEGDELNELPWQDYLNVFEDSGSYRITSSDETYYQVGGSDPKLAYPTKMEIDLAHNNDSIEETLWFEDRTYSTDWYQDISETYQFMVNGNEEYSSIADYYAAVSLTSAGFTLPVAGDYTLVADFYVISNTGEPLSGDYTYDDLRDMLSVGLFSLNNGANLEAIYNCGGVFDEPIDVIVSPMKDTNWQTNVDWTNWTQGQLVGE